jgi:hypothetical protein
MDIACSCREIAVRINQSSNAEDMPRQIAHQGEFGVQYLILANEIL